MRGNYKRIRLYNQIPESLNLQDLRGKCAKVGSKHQGSEKRQRPLHAGHNKREEQVNLLKYAYDTYRIRASCADLTKLR